METTQTPPDVTVVFPGAIAAEIAISMSPLLMQQWKQIAVTEAMTEYAATIERQKSAMAAMEAVNQQQSTKLREAAQVIAEQVKRIAELEGKPPVIVPPAPPVVPVTPKDAVFPFCAGYFEDDQGAVDTPAQASARADVLIPHMEFAAETNPAMNDYIFFANIEDIKHKRLMDTVKRLKKRAWLSPAQAYYKVGQATQTACIDHLKAAHSAGFDGAIVDDAHNIPAKDMIALITLINTYMPAAPVICSFGATFDDKAKGYPVTKYIDARQWFLEKKENEDDYFAPWDKAFTCDIYMGDVYRRGSKTGYIHAPEKAVSMFREALPLVNGVGFYTVRNDETDHRADHLKAKQANPKAFTVWDAIVQCSNEYVAEYAKRTVKV